MLISEKATDETAEPILTYNIQKRMSPQEVCTSGGQNNNFTIVWSQKPPKNPNIGPNRHFTAKSTKS